MLEVFIGAEFLMALIREGVLMQRQSYTMHLAPNIYYV
jgi:hypothetical protein